MVLQSDLMYPAAGYMQHQHNYSHEEEDNYYAQNSDNYSSMQMMRPNKQPTPTTNYMISSSHPSDCHVAMAPPANFGHHDHRNKEKFYEEFKYQDGYGYHDNRNKEKYYENKEKSYQDGYGHFENRNKFENKEREKYQDNGYGRHENRNKDKYYESNEKEKYQDSYGYSHDDYYGHGHNGGKHEEGHNKFSIDKLMSGGGGYGAETHFVIPHMRRPRPFDHEKKMHSWEFKSIDD